MLPRRLIWIAAGVFALILLALLSRSAHPEAVSAKVIGITNTPVPQYLILITNGTRQSHAVSASIESFENGWQEVNQGIHSLSLLSGTAVTTILPETAHAKRRIALRCFPLNGSRWRERLLAFIGVTRSQAYSVYLPIE